MNETILNYQCPNCGAPLAFQAGKDTLVCDSCDSEIPVDYFEDPEAQDSTETQAQTGGVDWNTQGFVKEKPVMEDQQGFNCTSCGAQVVAGDTIATECMYCGNPIVVSENISGMVAPDLILPFKITRDEAKEKLKAFYAKKRLLPKTFKDENRIAKISGMYVPFWLFTCSGDGTVTYNATIVNSWRSGDYRYTKTKYYKLTRAGNISFDKIPVDASKKMDDTYMEGIEPFSFDEAVSFSPTYMAGYFADKFDENVDESAQRATARVINSVEDCFRDTISGYTTVTKSTSNIQMIGEDIHYVLLPVWMLNTEYKGKMYQFAINGQTGTVAGSLPIDKMKLWLYRLVITAIGAIPLSYIINVILTSS